MDEEAVLYDPAAHTLHLLNAGAATVWARCDGTATTNDISLELEDVYSDARVLGDVRAIIERFRRANLLQ